MPELRHLRAFIAVAEERNFTRAAERLSVSQQAVSRTIAQLEDELDVVLLERSTHEVKATPAGQALLAGGRRALGELENALQATLAVGAGIRGPVAIGLTPAVGPRLRGELGRVLRQDSRGVEVSFREIRPGELEAVLEGGSVDVVIARAVPPRPGIQSRPLRPTRAAIFLPVGHPLACSPTVEAAQLDGERLLTWSSPGSPYTGLLVELLRAAGARVSPVLAPITGGNDPPPLDELSAVALLPEGWPAGGTAREHKLLPEIELPLQVLWRGGIESSWARRIVAALGGPAPDPPTK